MCVFTQITLVSVTHFELWGWQSIKEMTAVWDMQLNISVDEVASMNCLIKMKVMYSDSLNAPLSDSQMNANEEFDEWIDSLFCVSLSETSAVHNVLTAHQCQDLHIADKYQLQRRISEGGYSAVYIDNSHAKWLKWVHETDHTKETNIDTDENVIIKLKHVFINLSLLKDEVNTYQSLSEAAGIPWVHTYEMKCKYNIMVFDLLRLSLKDLFNFCSCKFSLKTVLMLTDQLIDCLKYIHFKNVIHWDIKPENFLMGEEKHENQIYVTDLRLIIEHCAAQINTDHVWNSHLIDTAYFVSINSHLSVDKCNILSSCCTKTNA